MATAVVQLIREAIVAILSANATVISLSGGTARIVDRGTIGPAVNLPAVAYELLTYSPATGHAAVLLTAFSAAPADAMGAAWELDDAARLALTQTAFAVESLDIAVGEGEPQDSTEVELIDLGKPNLRQADWLVPLMIAD